jgi:hypothetical protein
MSMILSWVFFPLVLAALGLGWGTLVQLASGDRQLGPLTIPLGLTAALICAAVLTSWNFSAPYAAPVTALVALAGLAQSWGRVKLGWAPAVAAAAVVFVYGAPIIFSGQASFLGYVRLDDTATWFSFVDQFFTHARDFSALPPSTFKLLGETNLATGVFPPNGAHGSAYPAGAFMLLGVGHWISRIDVAWIFQPYLACCAAALALTLYDLGEPLLEWRSLRGFVAAVGACSALLWGYAAWGGIKELTAAFLLGLAAALATRLIRAEKPGPRNAIPLAIVAAALEVTLGPYGAVYVLPVLGLVFGGLFWRTLRGVLVGWRAVVTYVALIAMTAAFALPLWLTLRGYLYDTSGSFTSSAGGSATSIGNLDRPLRAIQIAGIWLYGDFRTAVGSVGGGASTLNLALGWLVFVAGGGAVAWLLWRRRPGLAIYAAIAIVAVLAQWEQGVTPWLIGKAMAISSPAVLFAGLVGGGLLFRSERTELLVAGVLVLGAIAGFVGWSDWEQYHDVTIAPRARLSELQTIGTLIAGKGPTFFNEYEIYGDRHFLRAGNTVEPSEYRPVNLPTVTGVLLTKPAWADIDSFPLSTLEPYRSLVVRVNPVASVPPSIYGYKPVWSGDYYQLWEQPRHAAYRVIEHVPLGDSTTIDYCGDAEDGQPYEPLCSVKPAAVPSCPTVKALAQLATQDGGELLAYERGNPIALRGTQTTWPSSWSSSVSEGSLFPNSPGTAVAHVAIPTGPHRYQLWLSGSFVRGFDVSVDGHPIGDISNQLNPFGDGYNRLGTPFQLAAGVHTIDVTYPQESLAPGSADNETGYTALAGIVLQPVDTPAGYIHVTPADATTLCGRSLDWIEVIAPRKPAL